MFTIFLLFYKFMQVDCKNKINSLKYKKMYSTQSNLYKTYLLQIYLDCIVEHVCMCLWYSSWEFNYPAVNTCTLHYIAPTHREIFSKSY